ncbi:glycosyl transferase family 1 [Roseivivax halodurans JCM 10272]|uniref:Glycosyl transferase family 1 n=1 Tax=Roseivivax halodurans JCM 10272 TaxID=1449350 RepID=X7EGM4_9RHOB|nr:glycosyltransferase family 4 protein [Roseivivax halodurans]ETX14361.1 glycosyl transferase family 1 [Roseivivax halodurans JCM 10272]
MSHRAAAFAIPGDITTLTGGYIYERKLLEGLRAIGHDVAHLELGSSFPDPTPEHMADAIAQLEEVAPDRPVIVDGLVFGSIDTGGLARCRAPIVAMIHHPLALESGLGAEEADRLFRCERDNLALTSHVLVPSPHTREILVQSYGADPSRITIARPGVARPQGPPERVTPPLILSVGIQHPRKGHDVLLRALGKLRDLDWQAIVVGKVHDDAYAVELEALLGELKLGDRVRFAGRVPQEEIGALYRQAALFALATRYEGYGIVFDEALVHGLPIVSCATGAVPDTVPQGSGILVPVDDPDAFAGALRKMLEDEGLRAGCAEEAAAAGAQRPDWTETARIASEVLGVL